MISKLRQVLLKPEDKIAHICRTTGDSVRLQRILRRNPDININLLTFDGLTALHLAALAGHVGVCEMLIFGGVVNSNPNVKTIENGALPLHMAAWHGSSEVLKLLIERAAVLVDEVTADGYSALHYACWGGMLVSAKYLLKRGASVAKKNNDGYTPLVIAARCGKVEIVEYLLASTASDIDDADNNGCTALHHACWDGHRNVVRVLLRFGAKVAKADQKGRRAVDLCKTRDIKELVQSVGLHTKRSRRREAAMERSPSPTQSTVMRTPLLNIPSSPESRANGPFARSPEFASSLYSPLEGSTNSNAGTGGSPVVGNTKSTLTTSSSVASELGHIDAAVAVTHGTNTSRPRVAQFLSFLGGNRSTSTSETLSPIPTTSETDTASQQPSKQQDLDSLFSARKEDGGFSSPSLMHRPVWREADEESDQGSSEVSDEAGAHAGVGLFVAPSVIQECWALCAVSGNAKALYRLLRAYPSLSGEGRRRAGKYEAPISAMRDAEHWSPLMRAASKGFTDVVKLLLLVGVDAAAKDLHGNTALHYAAWYGQHECISILLTEIEASAGLATPSDLMNTSSLSVFLTYSGPSALDLVNAANNNSVSPLHRAAQHGHLDAVKLLVERGASTSAVDKLGWSALHYACHENHADVVAYLLQTCAVDPLAITKASESPTELTRDANIKRLLKAKVVLDMTPFTLIDAKKTAAATFNKAIKTALSGQAPAEEPLQDSASEAVSVPNLTPVASKTSAESASKPKLNLKSALKKVSALSALRQVTASVVSGLPQSRSPPSSPMNGKNVMELSMATTSVDADSVLSALNRRKGKSARPMMMLSPQTAPASETDDQSPRQTKSDANASVVPVEPNAAEYSSSQMISSLRSRILSRLKKSATSQISTADDTVNAAAQNAAVPAEKSAPTGELRVSWWESAAASEDTVRDDAASRGIPAPPLPPTDRAKQRPLITNSSYLAEIAMMNGNMEGRVENSNDSPDMLLFAVVLTQVFSTYSNSLSRLFYRWKHKDAHVTRGTPLASWKEQRLNSKSSTSTSTSTTASNDSTLPIRVPTKFTFDQF